MSHYPRIIDRIPLYRCIRPCRICGVANSDTRLEAAFNCFKGSNERYDVHSECVKDMTSDQILTRVGCNLTIGIEKQEFLSWRRNLFAQGYGSWAKINMDTRKGVLSPGRYPKGY